MIKSKIKRSIILSVLWILLCVALAYANIVMLLMVNLFSWNPNLDGLTILTLLVVVILNGSIIVLARYTTEGFEIWIALLAALGLMIFGVFVLFDLYSENIKSGFFSRTKLSPHWFRITLFTSHLVAIISWLLFPLKYLRELYTTRRTSRKVTKNTTRR